MSPSQKNCSPAQTIFNDGPSHPSPIMKDWIKSTYEKLGLDADHIDNISPHTDPYETFGQITDKLIADPTKYADIIIEITNTPLVSMYFPPNQRYAIANIYPDDKEIALKLLVDIPSYYKCIERTEYDEDGEEYYTDYKYQLITHCGDYYFLIYFYEYPKHHHGLKAALEENGINTDELKYYKDNDAYKKLYEFHKQRNM